MRPFLYCPACASRLEDPDAEGTTTCPSCGRDWYQNPAPTVGCLIIQNGRGLVTVRGRKPHKGRVDLAGGFLRVDEHPIAGLKREVEEELGIEINVSMGDLVQIVPHQYEEANGAQWLLSLGFVGRLRSGEPSPADDVADIKWVMGNEVDALEWAWPHDRELARKVLSNELSGS
jgi:NADH pyrophosphatase NudC (nudix superfamily)